MSPETRLVRSLLRRDRFARGRKTAIHRVEIERQDGKVVAAFGGTVYITGRPVAAGKELRQAP